MPLIVVVTVFGELLCVVVSCFAPLMYQSGRPACSVISSVQLEPSVISAKARKRLSSHRRLGILRVGRVGRRVREPPGADAVGSEVVARDPGPSSILVNVTYRHAAARLRGRAGVHGNGLGNSLGVLRIVEVVVVVDRDAEYSSIPGMAG